MICFNVATILVLLYKKKVFVTIIHKVIKGCLDSVIYIHVEKFPNLRGGKKFFEKYLYGVTIIVIIFKP